MLVSSRLEMKIMAVNHCDATIVTSKEISEKQAVTVMKKHILGFQR